MRSFPILHEVFQLNLNIDAYYCAETVDELGTVDDVSVLHGLEVPHEQYTCARTSRAREAAIRSHHTAAPLAVNHKYNRTPHILPPYSYHPSDDMDHHSSPSEDNTSSSDESSSPLTTPSVSSLAPLEYLENLPRMGRHPMDDHALRLFDSVHSVRKVAPVYF